MDRRAALRLLLAGPLLWGACKGRAPADPVLGAVERAVAFLGTVALADGRVPGTTYGIMREGHATTALVARALVSWGPGLPATGRPLRDAALSWLSAGLSAGPLGLSGPAPDYPVYATALGLVALQRAGAGQGLEAATAWLRAQQLLEGWEAHPAWGGFVLGRAPGQPAPAPPHPGHVDLSMTRRALQALAASSPPDDPALAAGLAFTLACRAAPSPDGGRGFVYSPAELALNKGALAEGVDQAQTPADQKGYGSATADGLLALLACGRDAADPDAQAAQAWIQAHHQPDRNPGLEDAPIAAYGPAMRFYYRATVAESAAALSTTLSAPARQGLLAAILAEQRADGRWQGELALQKEDDPVIATALSILALGCLVAGDRPAHEGPAGGSLAGEGAAR